MYDICCMLHGIYLGFKGLPISLLWGLYVSTTWIQGLFGSLQAARRQRIPEEATKKIAHPTSAADMIFSSTHVVALSMAPFDGHLRQHDALRVSYQSFGRWRL